MTKGRQRSGKWYLQNEKKVLRSIGLTPCKGSGNGELEKEDGFNDNVLAQLKSTDKQSYRISQDDLEKLKYHARVDHKTPLFLIEFLEEDELWFCCMKEDIIDIVLSMFEDEVLERILSNKKKERLSPEIKGDPEEEVEWKPPKKVESGDNKKYRKNIERRYKK